jgi:two-component system, NarL family, sensor histidine kinase UhpB
MPDPISRGARIAHTCLMAPEPTPRRRSLFWQVFLPNALILALAVGLLAFSPISVSSEVTAAQAVPMLIALGAMLAVNLALIRRAVRPLEQLTEVMAAIDPLHPGQRVTVSTSVAETAELADVFNAMIERLETERRESGRRMLSATERERVRLARELHDEIGQSITALMLEVDHVARGAPDEVARQLRDVQETARGLSDEVRDIVRGLRPEALDDLGLQSALVGLAQAYGDGADLTVRRSLDADLRPLDPDVELVAYRVAQESLTNVARHAEATTVELTLERTPTGLLLRVGDDGRGFGASSTGSGMKGMLERALLIGGEVVFKTSDLGGAEVRLLVPLEAELA